MQEVYFVAVILKVPFVNLLAVLHFANVFKNKKKRLENKKNVKNVKNVTKIKKQRKTFLHLCKQGRNWCSRRRGPTEAMNSITM